jgi:hypothetical protein
MRIKNFIWITNLFLSSFIPICQATNAIQQDINLIKASENITIPELDPWGGLVRVDKDSAVAIFDEGKSSYSIMKLPQVRDKYTMRVEITFPAARDYGILWPTILLLDEKMQVIQKVSTKPKLKGSLFANDALLKVKIDPVVIKYSVFYLDPSLLGKSTTLVWPQSNGSLQATTNFSQYGEMQIYNYKDTKKCLFSANLDKCQPK